MFSELNLHDDAIVTLKAALAKDPNNEVLARQLKQAQARKSGIAVQKTKKPMTESQRKEVL